MALSSGRGLSVQESFDIGGCTFELNDPLALDVILLLLLLGWGFEVYCGLDVKMISLMDEMRFEVKGITLRHL